MIYSSVHILVENDMYWVCESRMLAIPCFVDMEVVTRKQDAMEHDCMVVLVIVDDVGMAAVAGEERPQGTVHYAAANWYVKNADDLGPHLQPHPLHQPQNLKHPSRLCSLYCAHHQHHQHTDLEQEKVNISLHYLDHNTIHFCRKKPQLNTYGLVTKQDYLEQFVVLYNNSSKYHGYLHWYIWFMAVSHSL